MRVRHNYIFILVLLSGIWFKAQCQTIASQHSAITSSLTTDPVFESLNYKFQTHKMALSDGQTIAYIDEGKGTEAIILIHGLGSYLSAWDKNIPELSQKHRTIAIDLPGYGKSSKANVSVGMQSYAKAVLELMDKLHLKESVLVGHSMGGQVAITTALLAPDRVKKLVLAAPAGLETFSEQQKQLFKLNVTPQSIQQTTPDQIRANFEINFYTVPVDAHQMLDERFLIMKSDQFSDYSKAVATSVAAMLDEPVHHKLRQLNLPVLILFGHNDNLIPNKYFNPTLTTETIAEAGKKLIPNCQTVILSEAGHFVQYEQPRAFNRAVVEFIKNK